MAIRPELTRADFLRLLAGAGGAAVLGAATAGAEPSPAAPTPPTDAPAAPPLAPEPIMKRPIPKTGEMLPILGLGTWQTFDIGDDPADRAPRAEVLRLLFESGGSVIDSSPMYGRAEGVVGDLLAEAGSYQSAFLATKVWTRGREAGIAQMADSFSRFRAEIVDLMQIHNLIDWRTHLQTLRAMKEDGAIRYIGVTHYTRSAHGDLVKLIESEDIDFVQFNYSISERSAEHHLLPAAAERGVAVIANLPFDSGGLFRSTRGEPLPDWATEFDCTSWAQFFLKYVLSHPAVTCAIPGTAKPHHMADNLAAARGRLPDAKMRERMVHFWEDV